MANHSRRNWRRFWAVDLARRTATHSVTGAQFHFPASAPAVLIDAKGIESKLCQAHGRPAGLQMLQSLARDAQDIYRTATKASQAARGNR